MKRELTDRIYKKTFDHEVKANSEQFIFNKEVRAVVQNYKDERGDIIVTNDNFGTRRKYPCFEEGKKAAGLHPLQIVFSGLETAKMFHERYINKNGEIVEF